MASTLQSVKLRRFCKAALAGLTVAFGLGVITFAALWVALPDPDISKAARVSPLVMSEDGKILKAYLTDDSKWRFATTPADVPDHYLKMLLAYEDGRYFNHRGVDILALARAVYTFARRGRAVSGASTLTMQTVRLLDGQKPGLWGKITQAMLAMKLERRLDKQQILSIYLTIAPFGGNIEGVRAASLQYFGIEPRHMSVGQAALLVALPQSPERRRPANADGSRSGRNWVLQQMRARQVLEPPAITAALREPIAPERNAYRFMAHHLSDRLHYLRPRDQLISTFVDSALQTRIETIGSDYAAAQPDNANIAILVVRNRDLAVRAYLGGATYFAPERAGMYDLVRAIRSPGSALKPYIYALAFEDLVVHPNTIAFDGPVRFGDYAPENFDRKYRGEMLVRDALVQSINTVAVSVLSRVGPERFVARLRDGGIHVELPEPGTPPGLPVALGGLGISLENLATLFAGFANRGLAGPLRLTVDSPMAQKLRLTSRDAAWAIADVLADAPPARARAALVSRDGGRRIAYKTGTSYGFKDAWSIGFDADHVVAVWVGRADGLGRPGETGASSAVPIMQRVFDLLPLPEHDVAADRPVDSVLARTRNLPDRLRRLTIHTADPAHVSRAQPFEIRFPSNGATIRLTRSGAAYMPLTISTAGGRPPFRWLIDGQAAAGEPSQDRFVWLPAGRGQVEFVVIDADGMKASSTVWFD